MTTFQCRSCRKRWTRKDDKDVVVLGWLCRLCKRREAMARALSRETPREEPKDDSQLALPLRFTCTMCNEPTAGKTLCTVCDQDMP